MNTKQVTQTVKNQGQLPAELQAFFDGQATWKSNGKEWTRESLQARFDAMPVGAPAYRHGDLVYQKVQRVHPEAKMIADHIMVRSKVTGHKHGVTGAATVWMHGERTYVEFTGPAAIHHHVEHRSGPAAIGVCEVVVEREGRSDAFRRQVD